MLVCITTILFVIYSSSSSSLFFFFFCVWQNLSRITQFSTTPVYTFRSECACFVLCVFFSVELFASRLAKPTCVCVCVACVLRECMRNETKTYITSNHQSKSVCSSRTTEEAHTAFRVYLLCVPMTTTAYMLTRRRWEMFCFVRKVVMPIIARRHMYQACARVSVCVSYWQVAAMRLPFATDALSDTHGQYELSIIDGCNGTDSNFNEWIWKTIFLNEPSFTAFYYLFQLNVLRWRFTMPKCVHNRREVMHHVINYSPNSMWATRCFVHSRNRWHPLAMNSSTVYCSHPSHRHRERFYCRQQPNAMQCKTLDRMEPLVWPIAMDSMYLVRSNWNCRDSRNHCQL